ncbi:MAG: hypothetical protein LWW85_07170 [Marinilabiliales bacterium]|nr:hypothetical protein [Marinilabiliales bacterium]
MQTHSQPMIGKWPRFLYIVGAVAAVVGAIDPLEGSVLILTGTLLLSLACFLRQEEETKLFLVAALLTGTGVAALFILSSMGGFGGTSELSGWWGLTILPYPIGWILTLTLLIKRKFRHPKH